MGVGQNAYALCYLMDAEQRCYFRIENNNTTVGSYGFKHPDISNSLIFQHMFQFRMSLQDISELSLVLGIWDNGVQTASYLGGFRLKLDAVQCFLKTDCVWIESKHQEIDGHPAEISAQETFGSVSEVPPPASELMVEEIRKTQRRTEEIRTKLVAAREERREVETEYNALMESYRQRQLQLRGIQETLFNLDTKEAELSAQVVSLNHLQENIIVI